MAPTSKFLCFFFHILHCRHYGQINRYVMFEKNSSFKSVCWFIARRISIFLVCKYYFSCFLVNGAYFKICRAFLFVIELLSTLRFSWGKFGEMYLINLLQNVILSINFYGWRIFLQFFIYPLSIEVLWILHPLPIS